MKNELIYQLALTMIPHVGSVHARILLQHYEPEDIFHARRTELEKMEGIGTMRAAHITNFKDFTAAEKELAFIEKNRVRPLFITDNDYPKRLLNCYDAPLLLFLRGNVQLNASKLVAIIGTRKCSDYGRQVTQELVTGLAPYQVTIVSGLAYGIDGHAHKAALDSQLPTIGVLAHGLDQVYPPFHRSLASQLVNQQGGLLTEFFSGTEPDKHNFPSRNRIVAGMCDATIVIETSEKGGSMITADLANGYNRDVFAFPGRVHDAKSAGCHLLVRQNKACLATSAEDIAEHLGWQDREIKKHTRQRILFPELSEEERKIVDVLQQQDTVHIDELNLKSGLSASSVAAAILNLELQNVIVSLPGKLYRLD